MLTFCERCKNVMVLKQRKGRSNGKYECRTCGLVKEMKIEKIEIKERNFEEESRKIPRELQVPFNF